jgi:hypothetical protein
MMHDRAWRALGAASLYSIFVACAGGETPATNAELRDQITAIYVDGDGAVGNAGGGGGRSGAGGSAQAEAGSGGDDGEPGGRGGSGQSSSGGSGSGDECDGYAILEANCGSSGCHGEGSLYSNFAESEDAARAFVGESGESSCSAEGPLIDPENPPASIIIQKVAASAPPCGSRMPVVGGPLSQADITCLQEWIGSL